MPYKYEIEEIREPKTVTEYTREQIIDILKTRCMDDAEEVVSSGEERSQLEKATVCRLILHGMLLITPIG